ncbi:MAG: ABC transporter permease [Deltaproteobacteria bacterium]|nr:ABC transporter permease [Deltaproteobacteria bacterium]
MFQQLDWMIAWRHLRSGDVLAPWVRPLLLGSIYLIVIGALLAVYAGTLDDAGGVALDAADPPSALQRYFGGFGGITLLAGVMALAFALLARFFNLLPTIIAMSVLLGCMALVVVLSLMSGLEADMRVKILNQKAHIRVARADGKPFDDYVALAHALAEVPGVVGASPYLEGEIMVRSRLNRQGAILSGILADEHATASNLPSLVQEGSYEYLSHPADIPNPDPFALDPESTPWRLRHLDKKDGEDTKLPPPPPARPVPDAGTPTAIADKRPSALSRELPPPPATGDDEGWEDPNDALRPEAARVRPDPAALAPDDDDEGGWEDPNTGSVDAGRSDATADRAEPDGERPSDADGGWIRSSDDDDVIEDPILIGRELAMELAIGVGSEVQLITPVGRMTPAGRLPGSLIAKVGGVFFSGMYEYDRKNVYAPLAVVQRFLLAGDRVNGIEVKLADVDAIDDGHRAVAAAVAAAGRGDELVVEDWRELNRNLFSAMFLEKVAMFIALLFVVLVASFGILASNLMSVMEKSKEIAILKAMGTSDRGIMRVFIAEGLCVGILGSLGGICMGLGLCWALDRYGLPLNENVYYVEKLPVVVNPGEVTLVGLAALVIVCVSSLYPALVASRLRPVDALRLTEK